MDEKKPIPFSGPFPLKSTNPLLLADVPNSSKIKINQNHSLVCVLKLSWRQTKQTKKDKIGNQNTRHSKQTVKMGSFRLSNSSSVSSSVCELTWSLGFSLSLSLSVTSSGGGEKTLDVFCRRFLRPDEEKNFFADSKLYFNSFFDEISRNFKEIPPSPKKHTKGFRRRLPSDVRRSLELKEITEKVKCHSTKSPWQSMSVRGCQLQTQTKWRSSCVHQDLLFFWSTRVQIIYVPS